MEEQKQDETEVKTEEQKPEKTEVKTQENSWVIGQLKELYRGPN